ncbi:putative membrane protein YGL010W [Pseudomonas nitritireducens]|uniref:Putative membrane protein YGL010W n=1 Tax=Pseudomonas nitroreducens TaxID=46680 RepID=A0A7W7KF64_PSENT|nr:hypothetical protein [Pseudomonas nitritireducens]MBB4861702.1 putative membrane protein YGL010W [Pseudomonas nitritireducens]
MSDPKKAASNASNQCTASLFFRKLIPWLVTEMRGELGQKLKFFVKMTGLFAGGLTGLFLGLAVAAYAIGWICAWIGYPFNLLYPGRSPSYRDIMLLGLILLIMGVSLFIGIKGLIGRLIECIRALRRFAAKVCSYGSKEGAGA